jgi:NAD(P)H dehydrogenase (quinone)
MASQEWKGPNVYASRFRGRVRANVDLTGDQLKAGFVAVGQRDWQATALVEMNAYARQGHASMVTDTVQRITGRPTRTLERWAQEHASAFRP